MKLEILKQLNAERAARRPVIIVTDTANGEQRLVNAADIAADPLRAELAKQLRMGKSGNVEVAGKKLFLNVYAPTAKLVIIGAVHISQALAPLARSLDYDVTVVDPRTAFASPERFPDVPLVAEWPDVALPPLNVDHYTAFVAVTHDPKIDDPALLHAFVRPRLRSLREQTNDGLGSRATSLLARAAKMGGASAAKVTPAPAGAAASKYLTSTVADDAASASQMEVVQPPVAGADEGGAGGGAGGDVGAGAIGRKALQGGVKLPKSVVALGVLATVAAILMVGRVAQQTLEGMHLEDEAGS